MQRPDVPSDRERLHRRIAARTRVDAEWAAWLRRDPKSAIEDEIGVELPPHLNVVVVQETAGLMCIVLPRYSSGIHPDAASSLLGAGRARKPDIDG